MILMTHTVLYSFQKAGNTSQTWKFMINLKVKQQQSVN